MTAFEDGLWTRLVGEHNADQVTLAAASAPTHRSRPLLIGTGLSAIVAATAAGVFTLSATTAPPAYAMTQNPDGSVTVTINNLETAIPELNARFAALGIDETVVPVEASCPAHAGSGFAGAPLFVAPQESGSDTLTFTPGRKYLAPGTSGVVAAEQLPDGEVAMAVEAVYGPVPSCFPTIAYTLQPAGEKNGIPVIDATPVTGTSTATSTGAATPTTATAASTTPTGG